MHSSTRNLSHQLFDQTRNHRQTLLQPPLNMLSFNNVKRAAIVSLLALTVPFATIIIPFHIIKQSTMATYSHDNGEENEESESNTYTPENQVVNQGLLYIQYSGEDVSDNCRNIVTRVSHNILSDGQQNIGHISEMLPGTAGNGHAPSFNVDQSGPSSSGPTNGHEGSTGNEDAVQVNACVISKQTAPSGRSLGWKVEKGGPSGGIFNTEDEVSTFFPPPTTFVEEDDHEVKSAVSNVGCQNESMDTEERPNSRADE